MKKLLRLVKKNPISVISSLILISAANIAQFVWTVYIGQIADLIVGRMKISLSLIGTMAIILLVSILLLYLSNMAGRFSAEKMAHTLRMDFAKSILNGNQFHSGGYEAMSKAENELTQASDYMTNTLTDIVQMTLSGILVLVFLLIKNPFLTLIIFIPMIITVVAVKLIGKNLIPLVNASMDKKIIHNKTAYMAINNYEAIKIFDSKAFFKKRYTDELMAWAKTETKKERVSAVCNSLSGILSQIPMLILFASGGILIFKGFMTIGTLMIFINMSASLLSTLMNLPSWTVSFKSFLVHLKRADINYHFEIENNEAP